MSETHKVLITDSLAEQGRLVLESATQIHMDYRPGLKAEEIREIIGGYDALIVRSGTRATADIIEAGSRLKVIGRAGIGVDNIDVDAASKRGIVGVGNIGSVLADRAQGLKMKVVAYDPYLAPESAARVGIELTNLDDLFARADFISVHTPLTTETRGLIGREAFAKMKKGVRIVNCARGGIVDEAALARHLASGHLGGAAVDVYSTEPPAADNPLLTLTGEGARRLLLTPHIAGVTRQSSALLFRSAWQNVERVLARGEPPLHRVY